MPSMPRKQPLAEFLARKGFWVFYPRYRGAWESGGQFLARSPQEDIKDVVSGLLGGVKRLSSGGTRSANAKLPGGFQDKDGFQKKVATAITELAFGQRFTLTPEEIFVIGGSFGGAASILASLDPRVKKVIANCPVVDWSILPREQKKETSNPSYAAYIREAFGQGYRLTDKNWAKLSTGRFYNPAHHAKEITPSKVLMFHAQDDHYIPWRQVQRFADRTGVRLKLLRRGGHLSTDMIVRKYWPQIKQFFESGV